MGSDLAELGSGVCRLTFTRAHHRNDASLDRVGQGGPCTD